MHFLHIAFLINFRISPKRNTALFAGVNNEFTALINDFRIFFGHLSIIPRGSRRNWHSKDYCGKVFLEREVRPRQESKVEDALHLNIELNNSYVILWEQEEPMELHMLYLHV